MFNQCLGIEKNIFFLSFVFNVTLKWPYPSTRIPGLGVIRFKGWQTLTEILYLPIGGGAHKIYIFLSSCHTATTYQIWYILTQ